MKNLADEINPYILYRLEGTQVECALWQLQEGPRALAFFLSYDSAAAYHSASGLGAGWKVFRPARGALLELLRTSHAAGIGLAVLDPDATKALRVFDIGEILQAAGL